MKVYLVEDVGNAPGRVYAVFAHEKDAKFHARAVESEFSTECEVVERTLIYGQAPILGYNQ